MIQLAPRVALHITHEPRPPVRMKRKRQREWILIRRVEARQCHYNPCTLRIMSHISLNYIMALFCDLWGVGSLCRCMHVKTVHAFVGQRLKTIC